MCGFLVHKGNGNNRLIKQRGQDDFNKIQYENFIFEHYLLHLTGEKTLQPFIKQNIVCLFNGEIYNYQSFGNYKTDGECLIDLYLTYGFTFANKLDGEFAISLYDFNNQIALFITDCFATKPIWINNELECASYESGINNSFKLQANKTYIYDLNSKSIINLFENKHFDFNNQYKTNYDDCITAFQNSIKKRAKDGCFIGLSSGYDSGAIACELNNQNINFKAYSIKAAENINIILKRAEYKYPVDIYKYFNIDSEEKHLALFAESFNYKIEYDSHLCTDSYKKDYAAKALSFICRMANVEKRKIYLSGTGADEILSDYTLIPNQSKFKGKFPEKLDVWPNFQNSCMYSYLGKEECVAGSWNIETRYPFLDFDFVQEFLWLSTDLKNKYYKSVLHEYLTRNNYPFEINKKIGFSI